MVSHIQGVEVLDLVDLYIRDRDRYADEASDLLGHIRTHWSAAGVNADPDIDALPERRSTVNRVLETLLGGVDSLVDPGEIAVMLFVGASGTGHAFQWRGRFWAWLPVEQYRSPRIARAFIPHEVAHAVQYARQPDLYFSDELSRRRTGRQVVTEGFASWMAIQWEGIEPAEALWADFIDESARAAWMTECQHRRTQIARQALDAWQQDAGDLFYFTGSKDPGHNRGGYELGLGAWQRLLAIGWSTPDLLGLDGATLDGLIREQVRKMAR